MSYVISSNNHTIEHYTSDIFHIDHDATIAHIEVYPGDGKSGHIRDFSRPSKRNSCCYLSRDSRRLECGRERRIRSLTFRRTAIACWCIVVAAMVVAPFDIYCCRVGGPERQLLFGFTGMTNEKKRNLIWLDLKTGCNGSMNRQILTSWSMEL
jgi:hypothetical protein